MQPILTWQARDTCRSCAALGALMAAIIGIWAATFGIVVLAGKFPTLHHADAIMVLGAAQYNGKTIAGTARTSRLLARAVLPWLRKAHGVHRRRRKNDTVSEGEVARPAMQLPTACRIPHPRRAHGARRLRSPWRAAADLMRGANLHAPLIVSDRFHMLRCSCWHAVLEYGRILRQTPSVASTNAPGARGDMCLREKHRISCSSAARRN